MANQWSTYQENIFLYHSQYAGSGVRHALIVDAKAGSGKTTTLVEAVSRISRGNVLFLAFNREIVKVLAERMPGKNVRTSHSFGLQVCGKVFGKVTVDGDKERKTLETLLDRHNWGHIYGPILSLVGYAKKNLVTDWDQPTMQELADFYGIELNGDTDLIISKAAKVLELTSDNYSTVSFDDMLYLPYYYNVAIPKFDYVGVDETQDASPAQMNLFLNAMQPDGMWVGVGDKFQAINGFAGAGITSMEDLQAKMSADVLPLSISYRCPKAVVALINQEMPEIPFEAAPWAIEGEVRQMAFRECNFQPGDMILCRTNAPLVRPCFSLIRRGIKAIIKGRDIGEGLVSLCKKFKTNDLGELLTRMADYRDSETYKLRLARKEAQASALEDKIETVFALSDGCNTVDDVIYRCRSIFSDDKAAITFSSVHRSKGLEADNVYVLKPELLPHPAAKSDWELQQERNLKYVCFSRAKQTLTFVQGA